jgi:purine-cytosine permease-like protein
MAQGLLLGLGIPLWAGYLISTVMVIPLVIYGMKALSKLQVWTTPLWLVLMIGPVAYRFTKNLLVGQFATFTGHDGFAPVDMALVGYMFIANHANW